MCVGGGGLKTETDNFLLVFQNFKSSNRCRSVYGTDIKMFLTKFSNLFVFRSGHDGYGEFYELMPVAQNYTHNKQ